MNNNISLKVLLIGLLLLNLCTIIGYYVGKSERIKIEIEKECKAIVEKE